MEQIPLSRNPATIDWLPAPIYDQETVMDFLLNPIRSG
jgi:hypothetical protein